jgi:polysaccharide biosynthesis/export protein
MAWDRVGVGQSEWVSIFASAMMWRIVLGKFSLSLNRRLWAIASVAGLILSGCAQLPNSGANFRDIEKTAVTAAGDPKASIQYALVEVSLPIIEFLRDPGAGSFYSSFGPGQRTSSEIQIGTGDVVQVTIFESTAGGLFIPADAGSRPGNFIQLPAQTVDKAGYITVPYAGSIKASGRSLTQIQKQIEGKLASRAIEPQAVVAILNQKSNEVSVMGEVTAPAKVSISPGGDKVLDVISKAGGIRWPGFETFVTLQRRGSKDTVFFNYLIERPEENVSVATGDTIYVYREQRSFLAFGATGQTGQFKFEQEKLSLADGVARAGGLLDARADPRQVFLYRMEDRSTLQKMGVDLSNFEESQKRIPTVFRTSFRNPAGLFAAQKFPMRDKDMIYVSNADAVELLKFLNFVTATPNAIGTVADDVTSVNVAGSSF